jgi:hypothetical protein
MGFYSAALLMLGIVGLMFLAMRMIEPKLGDSWEFYPKSTLGFLVSIASALILAVLVISNVLGLFD